MDVDPNWYETFFEGDWLDVVVPDFERADPERADRMVDFVVEQLELEPGARILDLACGYGRISVRLAQRGFDVTGLDLSPRSLERARAAADEAGVGVRWVEADMREPPEGPFDACVNLWTAFGYFEDEAENQRVLDAVARVLVPGGRFLVDTINAPGLFKVFAERRWEDLGDGVVMLHDNRYDVLSGRNHTTWTFIRPDGARSELRHSLRLYAPHELAAMLARAGLEVDGAWGGFDGAELTRESWRQVLRARRVPR